MLPQPPWSRLVCANDAVQRSRSLTITRRTFRGHWDALLPPLGLSFRFANPLHPPWYLDRSERQVREHAIDSVLPGTIQARARRHSFPLPEDFVHHTSHSSGLDQVAHIQYCHGQSRWQAGLDHQPEAGAAGLDRTHPQLEASVQREARSGALGQYIHHRTWTACSRRERADLSGAAEGWRELCCAPSVSFALKLTSSPQNLTLHSNVVAYTASATPPMPYRFKSSNFRLQVPDLGFGSFVQNAKFFRIMSQTTSWRAVSRTWYTLKTWMRRSIWGDRVRHLHLISDTIC